MLNEQNLKLNCCSGARVFSNVMQIVSAGNDASATGGKHGLVFFIEKFKALQIHHPRSMVFFVQIVLNQLK